MNIPYLIDIKPPYSLYLVSFDQYAYDEYDSFLVVAYTEDEAAMLTPEEYMNKHIGIGLGYDLPEVSSVKVHLYRDLCGQGKRVTRIGEASSNLEWGDVPISSFNAG
jgi:hypothetical protein